MAYTEKVPDDIALVAAPADLTKSKLENAVYQITKAISQHPKSIVQELQIYRKYIPIILEACFIQTEGLKKVGMQLDRCTNISYDRSNKRWSKDEDETLIDQVCEGKSNIHQLSTMFGRSPGAIQVHISELVGRKRLSQEIAGKFIGKINGEVTEAEICGTVYKAG